METPTSTGKVKVEYSDPSGVYQLIASELQARLPLKTLNWNSASRPTRSIDLLYVDVVPDDKTVPIPGAKRSASGGGAPETPTSPSASGEFKRQESQSVKRERRHQIPGLRRTPYLRLYFLRCDDSDTYKATARRAVREWINTNSPTLPTGSAGSQKNHDASEYMIIHVVLPDVQTGATWPTKASSSVLEKLKSDFSSSSRNSPDRVVQIPSTKSLQVQGVTVNPIPTGAAKDVFLNDSAKAWDELIAKMKLLILNSFDSRVKQYEDDIKEKGNQRSLPGWNFCTFFVLKEGLARGFESVGLVDDALMGYDELSVEMMSAIRDENTKQSRLFREHTQELLIQAEVALQGQDPQKSRSGSKRSSNSVLDVDSKPYRELILANNISIFDFRSYVFARQTQIMLRLASLSGRALKANSSALDLATSRDPVILADVCWRAKEFFADMARVIRLDLKTCFRADAGATEQELRARYVVTENLIASWTYKGAIDILNKTREGNLPDVAATETDEDQDTLTGSPEEDSSRPASPESGTESQDVDATTPTPKNRLFLHSSLKSKASLSLDSVKLQSAESVPLPPGSSSLAAERAELYLIARRALSSVGERQGWKTTWPSAEDAVTHGELDEVSLENSLDHEKHSDATKSTPSTDSSMAGALDLNMRAVMADKTSFYRHWEELSLLAYLLFDLAKVQKYVYLITADIAAVRVRLEDYDYAAPFLRELAQQYTADHWHNLELAVLDMYVYCLKKLNKPEDYVPAALQMLAKAAKANRKALSPQMAISITKSTPFSNVSLGSIIEASIGLVKPLQISLDEYFGEVRLEEFIKHSPESDEYGLLLHFNSSSSGSFRIDQVDLKLTSNTGAAYKEILLSSTETYECQFGANIVQVFSKTMNPDWYFLDSIAFTTGKIRFFRSYKGTSFADRRLQIEAKSTRLLIWPSSRACTVEATTHSVIQLEQARALVFQIFSNNNLISHGKLLVKSGTAGLRLHTSDAEVVDGDCEITADKQPSTIPLGGIKPNSVIKIKIPYRVEGDLNKVNVRSELSYEVNGQTFLYCSTHQLSTQLSLGVNVQDIFKQKCLFSKFSISTSSDVPIQLFDCKLDGNDAYEVATPHMDNQDLVIFPKQPVSLAYRISKLHSKALAAKKKLSLQIDYKCLDEVVAFTIIEQMVEDLKQSQFEPYTPLLRSHLKLVLQQEIQLQELERVGLLRRILLPSYAAMDWQVVLMVLPTDVQAALSDWLQDWHKEKIAMSVNEADCSLKRHIKIPVEIPSLPILHTASLVIEQPPPSKPYTVGELIKGDLQISHTKYWSSPDMKLEQSISFVYELETSSDTWLIAGQRRGYFTATEGELKTFPILLLPLRAGKLMLPIVEIRIAKENDTDERTACETDYQSLGTAIEVVPGVAGVSLDVITSSSGGLDGEVKVLEVEREERMSV